MLKSPKKGSKNRRHPDLVRKEKEAAKALAKEKREAAAKLKEEAKKKKLEAKEKAKAKSPGGATKKVAAKAPTKKSKKEINKKAANSETIASENNLRELSGWFLVISSLVGVLSIVAQFASQGGEHLLGPYLGDFLSTNLIRAFGKLPVLLVLTFTGLLGLKTLKPDWDKLGWRQIVFALLSTLFISLLLSIHHQTLDQATLYDFENSGGYIGSLLVHFVLQPIFRASLWGSYITIGAAFFLTLIWGFNWKPSVWIENLLSKLLEISETAKLRAKERAEERLLENSPAAQLIRKKKQDELIKKKLSEVSSESEDQELPSQDPQLTEEVLNQEVGDSEVEPSLRESELAEDIVQERALDAVQILNNMTPEERNAMDQRELRKLIEDAKQINIARQLNQWEFNEKENVKIQGIISNDEEVESLVQAEGASEELEALQDPKRVKSRSTETDDLEPAIQVIPHEDKTIAMDISGLQSDSQPPKTVINPALQPTTQPVAKPAPAKKVVQPQSFVEYVVPDIVALLPEPPEQKVDLNPADLQFLSEQLEAKMATFKVQGKVVGITTGPVITRFEIDLAPGVKVSKIAGLERDLALALKAKSIRILAPIPGKAAVGIEVPNTSPQIVYGKSILLASAQEDDPDKITIALGQDIAGDPYTMDLAKAPHLLIAGQTGSGKSVCINTLMASILSSKKPDELKMLLVDPKVVELKPYEDIPHLLHPVITDPELAISALKWACWEMDRRYDVLAKIRTRNIAGFNAKILKGGLEDKLEPEENQKMPFIVIMIDELADLMMVAGKEVEVSIARIAQKARAVGIHLVLATQRPSTNVITGTIKANLPTRVCFKVASHIDARTVMDKAGGEKLLGRGDMLFRSISDPEPVRVHGAFLTDDEVEVVTDACSEQNVERDLLKGFDFDGSGGEADSEDDMGPRDDLFQDAAELAVHTGKASASMLQRRLQIGYARAGRLIDQLESSGIVGPGRGAKPRQILMDETELNSFLSGDVDRIILDED